MVLVLLPLSSLTAFAVVLAVRASDSADASTTAAQQVRAYGQLARASAAVDQELLVPRGGRRPGRPRCPDRARHHPAVRRRRGRAAGGGAGPRARTETDAQLALAAALPASRDAARTARDEVTELRGVVDTGAAGDLSALRADWTSVSDRLHERQNAVVVSAASAATSTGTSPPSGTSGWWPS